jgi:hypothetical protein
MALFEGKTPTERNKMIAAGVLGLVALVALYLAFGRGLFGGSTAAKPTTSPSPTPKTAAATRGDQAMPSQSEQDLTYQSTVVPAVFTPSAPDPGRNIFAFYEPPPHCKGSGCPSPPPPPMIIPTPSPVPTPPIMLTFISPQAVFAGQSGFRLEVSGQSIPADARIYFDQAQMPTTFVNDQRLVTEIQANLIAQSGSHQIIVQTPDGKKYSNQVLLNVLAPPTPQFQFIGAILRARGNNDTAIFDKQGKGNFAQRLNDIIDDRFRLVSISRSEAVVQDTQLGFKHKLPLAKPGSPTGGTSGYGPMPSLGPGKTGGFKSGFQQADPNSVPQGDIPGIPNNIPRYSPPTVSQPQVSQPQKKEDVDDTDIN